MRAITPSRFPWFDPSRYTFSLGLDVGGTAHLSGHSASAYDPGAGRIVVRGGMAEQAATAYDKIEAVLEAAGLGLGDAVRLVENVAADGMASYAEAADVREWRLDGARPAVSTVCVDRLLRPEALIEIAVTAARSPRGHDPAADSLVHLGSVLPVDDRGAVVGDGLVAQAEAAFDRAGRLLAAAGLDLSHVAKVVDHTTPATLADYRATGRVRRERLGPVWPASAGILMSRLAHPDALIALDVTASRHALEAVNPGWDRYAKLTYSPAVRTGDVLFLSGQAALDPDTERAVHPGDVVAQLEYTYGNVLEVLAAAGGGPEHLVETVEYVTPAGLARYRETAAVRQRLLRAPYPASTGIVCRGLLRPEFLFEVDPLAIIPSTGAPAVPAPQRSGRDRA